MSRNKAQWGERTTPAQSPAFCTQEEPTVPQNHFDISLRNPHPLDAPSAYLRIVEDDKRVRIQLDLLVLYPPRCNTA